MIIKPGIAQEYIEIVNALFGSIDEMQKTPNYRHAVMRAQEVESLQIKTIEVQNFFKDNVKGSINPFRWIAHGFAMMALNNLLNNIDKCIMEWRNVMGMPTAIHLHRAETIHKEMYHNCENVIKCVNDTFNKHLAPEY